MTYYITKDVRDLSPRLPTSSMLSELWEDFLLPGLITTVVSPQSRQIRAQIMSNWVRYGPKWDKYELFISIKSVVQNVLKTDLKKRPILLILNQTDPIWANSETSSFSSVVFLFYTYNSSWSSLSFYPGFISPRVGCPSTGISRSHQSCQIQDKNRPDWHQMGQISDFFIGLVFSTHCTGTWSVKKKCQICLIWRNLAQVWARSETPVQHRNKSNALCSTDYLWQF